MNEQIDCLSRALRFIEEHLNDAVSVGDMAAASGYSLFYFIRLFNQYVHHTPYDYLIRRRLTKATQEVLSTDRRLIDIALDYRFQNAETFSRAFYRIHHIQPSQLRKEGSQNERLMLTARTGRHLAHFQNGISLRPAINNRSQCFLTGMPILQDWHTESLQALLSQCRDIFPEKKQFILSAIPFREAGMQGKGWLLGYEVNQAAELPGGLVAQRMPAGRYAAFLHSGPLADIPLSLDYIYQTWLSNSEGQVISSNELYQFTFNEPGKIHISVRLK